MAFPQQFMDELIARSDIISVISRYVSLTRRGSGHLGLCPFHNEKTPSFSVSADKQFFHCFGCGAGGDVITFVMRIENLDFPEAVAKLAEWAGLEVPQSNYGSEERNKKKRALEASVAAAQFFHKSLKADIGTEARKYFAGRALSPQTIVKFGLGYSPDGWSGMLDELMRQGFSKTELLDAGLVSTGKSGNIYDRFRNRVMFPIIDARGTVIGFGGRVMDGGEPKYLNSPESSIFNKRRNLYALNLARKSQAGYFILAEGYMDVIALHQAGFDSAVASLGTSLTDEQASLMLKYKSEAVIAYDSDKAGRAATERAIEILQKAGLSVKILNMQGAKDPDEYIKKFGRDKFAKLIETAPGATEYKLGSVREKYDISDDAGRVQYIKDAVLHIARLRSPVEREIYAKRIAEETKVTKDAILSEAEREYKKLLRQKKKEAEKRAINPIGELMPKDKSARYVNPRSAVAEEALVSIIASRNDLAKKASESLSAEMFSSELLGRLFTLITQRHEDGKDTTMADISQAFSPSETEHIAAVFARNMARSPDAAEDYIEAVKKENIKKSAAADTSDFAAAAEFYRKKKGAGNGKQ